MGDSPLPHPRTQKRPRSLFPGREAETCPQWTRHPEAAWPMGREGRVSPLAGQPAGRGEGSDCAPGALAVGVEGFNAVEHVVPEARVRVQGSPRCPASQSSNGLDSPGGRVGAPLLPWGPSLRERRSPACGGVAAGFESSAPFLEGSPTPGHLAGRREFVPRGQPRALRALAVGVPQGFTPGSNQGTRGRRDRRVCALFPAPGPGTVRLCTQANQTTRKAA